MKRHKSLELRPIKGVYQTSQNHELSRCKPGEYYVFSKLFKRMFLFSLIIVNITTLE